MLLGILALVIIVMFMPGASTTDVEPSPEPTYSNVLPTSPSDLDDPDFSTNDQDNSDSSTIDPDGSDTGGVNPMDIRYLFVSDKECEVTECTTQFLKGAWIVLEHDTEGNQHVFAVQDELYAQDVANMEEGDIISVSGPGRGYYQVISVRTEQSHQVETSWGEGYWFRTQLSDGSWKFVKVEKIG